MNQKEQNILNEIDKASEDIRIPESLEPEEIERMLKNRKEPRRWKKSYTAGLAAACCLLVCGVAYGMTKNDAGDVTGGGSVAGANAGQDGGNADTESKEDARAELRTAESYEEIYGYLEETVERQKNSGTDLFSGETEMAVEESAAASDSAAASGADSGLAAAYAGDSGRSSEYSETNVRQEGVDEADVVKTDGRYLYTLRDNGRAVAIVDTAGDGLEAAAEVELEAGDSVCEFYVNDGKLTLVGNRYNETEDGWQTYGSDTTAFAVTYDLTDPSEPEKIGEVTQSGQYASSRMAEGHLYLFSRYWVYGDSSVRAEDTAQYIPLVNGDLIEAKKIYLPVSDSACQYEVISSVDMGEPGEVKDSKAVFANEGELYVSNENIYWYESQWGSHTCTAIRRISYEDGELTAGASGMVDGYIHDSFCIDEYKGYLRVITTEEDSNSVYVLDDGLEVTGSITGLAEEERVYSARLLGDTGYFVTYRETDPLFSVDFSDPENPRIIGELKIPGFSEYLHFYGEDQLLGIGMDVEEDGFTTNGVKLSMFDISDNANVQEVQKYVMENVYSADVMYDYRAALIDVEKNIIGFSAYGGEGESYYVFRYDDGDGFECLMDEAVNGNGYQTARGVYIDDTLYVVKGNIIEAYSMEDYRKTDDIIL